MNSLSYAMALACVKRLEAEVADLRAKEERAKQHAALNKEHLADGYWQSRHNAEDRLWTAKALLEALKE